MERCYSHFGCCDKPGSVFVGVGVDIGTGHLEKRVGCKIDAVEEDIPGAFGGILASHRDLGVLTVVHVVGVGGLSGLPDHGHERFARLVARQAFEIDDSTRMQAGFDIGRPFAIQRAPVARFERFNGLDRLQDVQALRESL